MIVYEMGWSSTELNTSTVVVTTLLMSGEAMKKMYKLSQK